MLIGSLSLPAPRRKPPRDRRTVLETPGAVQLEVENIMRQRLLAAILFLLATPFLTANSVVIDFEDVSGDIQPYLKSGYRLEATALQQFSVSIRPTQSQNGAGTGNTAVFPNFGFDDHAIQITRADGGSFSLLGFDLLEPNSLAVFPGPGDCRVVAQKADGSAVGALLTVDGTAGPQTYYLKDFHDLVSVTFEAAGEFRNMALDNLIVAESLILYPQLALGGGFDVIFSVTNRSGADWRGRAELDGGAWPPARNWILDGTDRTGQSGFDILLEPNQTRQFVLSRMGDAVSGWLEILPQPGSDAAALATAFFYNFSIGDQLEDSTGVAPARTTTAVRFPVSRATRLNTGLAVRRAGSPVTFTLYDQQGTPLQELTAPFDGAIFFNELFFGVGAQFIGSVEVVCPRGFFIVVLRQELLGGGAFQLTSIPALTVLPP